MEEELLVTKRALRQKDADHRKNTAILEQRVELLALELTEVKEREENQRKMHETLLSALRNDSSSHHSSITKQLEIAQKIHSQDTEELRLKYADTIASLERQLSDSRDRQKQLEDELRTFKDRLERSDCEWQHKLKEEELLRRETELRLKQSQDERKR